MRANSANSARAYKRALALLCILLQSGISTLASAQATLSTEEMVRRLRQPQTRSLRNLIVEDTVQSPDSAAKPSTSTAHEQTTARPSLSLLIQFEFNSAQLRHENQLVLKDLAKALQASELAGSHFSVEGHTDARGLREYNLELSRRRAEAVREVLVQNGADPARLIASGKGSSEPANAADPFSAENRRVRIVNLD